MWISTKDKLPPSGKNVLVYANSAIIGDDPNCKVKVMWLEYGISKEERLVMESSNDAKLRERSKSYIRSDQDGNNLLNYSWVGINHASHFGQDVLYWCEIPELPNDVIDMHNRAMEERKKPTNDQFWIDLGIRMVEKRFGSIN